MQQLMGLAIAMVIAREVFAGALRYYLDRFGLGPLWFLVDLALISAIGVVILHHLTQKVQDRYFYTISIVLLFITLGAFTGVAHGNNLVSILAAIKIALPLIATLIVYPHFFERREFKVVLALLFVCAVLGVFYNSVAEVPWAGYSISQLGVTRTASRQWWADGEARIAGLGSASGSTSYIILFMTFLVARNVSNKALKTLVYAFGMAGIYVTTSRTPMVAGAVAALVDLWPRRLGKQQNLDRAALTILFCMATIVPIAYTMVVVFGDDIVRFRDTSILDRLNFTWPTVLSMSYDSGPGGFLFGQGFGSIGSPAYYSGKYVSPISAADNFAMYMFALFGVMSLVILLLIYLCFISIPWRDRYFAFGACLIMATISCEGIGGALLVGYSVAFGLGALEFGRRGKAFPAPGAGPRLRGGPGSRPFGGDMIAMSGLTAGHGRDQ